MPQVQSCLLLGLTKPSHINYSALCHRGGYCIQKKNQVEMLPFQVYAIFQLPKIHQSFQQFLFQLLAIQKKCKKKKKSFKYYVYQITKR